MQLDKADKVYNDLIKITPNNHFISQNIGAINFSKGDSDKALDYFLKAIEIEPNGNNYSNIATIYFYKKNYKKAVEYFVLAVKSNPKQMVLICEFR